MLKFVGTIARFGLRSAIGALIVCAVLAGQSINATAASTSTGCLPGGVKSALAQIQLLRRIGRGLHLHDALLRTGSIPGYAANRHRA